MHETNQSREEYVASRLCTKRTNQCTASSRRTVRTSDSVGTEPVRWQAAQHNTHSLSPHSTCRSKQHQELPCESSQCHRWARLRRMGTTKMTNDGTTLVTTASAIQSHNKITRHTRLDALTRWNSNMVIMVVVIASDDRRRQREQ